MAVLVGGVVCYVIFRKVPRIMPPEAVEIQEQRQAAKEWLEAYAEPKTPNDTATEKPQRSRVHKNAYFALREAIDLRPQKPKDMKLIVQTSKGFERNIVWTKTDSLGLIVGIHRPDDDEKLLDYLENCRRGVEKAREAFAADYFRYPGLYNTDLGVSDITFAQVDYFRHPERYNPDLWVSDISSAQHGRGLFLSRIKAEHEEGLGCLIDAIETEVILNSDNEWSLFSTAHRVMVNVHEVAAQVASADVLRGELARFYRFSRWERSAGDLLEANWRMIDQAPVEYAFLGRVKLSYREDVLNNFMNNWGAKDFYLNMRKSREMRKYKQGTNYNKEDLLKAAALPLSDFVKQRFTIPEGRMYGWVGDNVSRGLAIYNIKQGMASANLNHRGIQLILALEIYQREHGEYPRQLEDLVPKCLSELPVNPYNEKNFTYKRIGSDYSLKADYGNVTPKYDKTKQILTYKVSYSEYTFHEPDQED